MSDDMRTRQPIPVQRPSSLPRPTPLVSIELPRVHVNRETLTVEMIDALLATGRASNDDDDFAFAWLIDVADVASGRAHPFVTSKNPAIASQSSALDECIALINAEIDYRRASALAAASDVSKHRAAGGYQEACNLPPPPPEWDRRVNVSAQSSDGADGFQTIASVGGANLEIAVDGYDHIRALDALEGLLLQQVAECRRLRLEFVVDADMAKRGLS